MSSTRKIAVVAGALFIVTEIAVIAGKVSLAARGWRPASRMVRPA